MKSPTWGSNSPTESPLATCAVPNPNAGPRARRRLAATDLAVTADQVARYFGGPHYVPNRRRRREILDGIEQAMDRVQPAASRVLHPVEFSGRNGAIELATGENLWLPQKYDAGKGGAPCPHPEPGQAMDAEPVGTRPRPRVEPRSSEPGGASSGGGPVYLAASLGTLGPGLETRSRELSEQGHLFQATLLDAVGTAMLDHLGRILRLDLERQARDRELFLGPRFSPGLDGYPMEPQALLCRLTQAEDLGVSLNQALIMEPVKSISFFSLISLTPGRPASGNKCRECTFASCQFRMANPRSTIPTHPDPGAGTQNP